MRLLVLLAALLAAAHAMACNTGLPNITLPDNGNVCDLLARPDPVLTTCSATISAGLNAAMAACSADDFIEITLTAGFNEAGPFIFPDVTSITLLGSGTSALIGGANLVLGNRTQLFFDDLVFDGEGTEDALFEPPLRSNNVTMTNVLMLRFHGRWGLVQEACEDDVELQVINNYFFDVWGASLFHSGLRRYNVQSNVFDRCGGFVYGATFLKTHWANFGTQIFFNNSHWVLFDEQPPLCITYFDGGEHVRCRDGVFECEDLTGTEIAGDCPRDINKTFVDPATNQTVWELLFQPFCRRYVTCECEDVIFRDISNVSVADFSLQVGDIIYPHLTLECQPGTTLVAGGAVGAVSPLQFNDSSFELDDNPPGGNGWTTNGDVIRPNSETQPKSRTGNFRVICNGHQDQWFEQTVNFTSPGAYLVSFWGARRDGQRGNYGGGFLEVYLDGMQVSSISNPTFEDTLVGDGVYYEFIFPSINVASAGDKVMRFRCNFAATGNLEFAIDDIQSRASGLEIVLFPPGLGNGPPLLADPVDFIAQPLAFDSFISPLPCPACPDPPERPPDLPCNYIIQQNFTCFDTIFNGTSLCVEPDLFNAGGGAVLLDQSMELLGNASVWVEVEGSPAIREETGLLPARTGTHILWVQDFDSVAIEQTITFTQSGVFTLTFFGQRGVADTTWYFGKQIQLFVDNVLVDTLSATDIISQTPVPFVYFLFFFEQQALLAGPHTIRLRLDWSGGLFPSTFAVDDIQFFNAFASASPSQTPSPSPSMAPFNTTIANNTVTVVCNNTNVTVECVGDNVTLSCNGTNITVPCFPVPEFPPNTLRCVEQMLYLGDDLYTGGCIVPGDLIVEFMGNNVTATQCMTTLSASGCTLPDMFSFELDGTLLMCASLEFGIMTCDCSSDKLLEEFLNRTLTADACAYEFDKIPNTATAFFIRENRAQQLDYGGCSRRIEYDTVVRSSVTPADFFDEKGVAREILKQSNQLWGRIPDGGQPSGYRNGPRFLQDGLSIYEEVCEDNCPMFNPTVPGSPVPFCIVDPTGADFVGSGTGNIYATIQEAIDAPNCTRLDRAIVVRNSENFYEENLRITRDDIIIFGEDNATIVGTHTVFGDVNVLFLRGLRWVHNGRNGQPQFDIDAAGDLRNLTIYNCDFSGDGVKDGGIVRNRGRTIDEVDFRYNYIRDYQTTALRFDAVNVRIAHNTWDDCSGRLAQFRYEGLVRLEHNVYINSRGAPDIEKPAMFEAFFRGRRDSAPCNVDASLCAVRRNVQLELAEEPEDSPDFKETGLLLRDGAYYIDTIRDNLVIKARTGLRIRRADFIVDVELLDDIGTNEFLEVLQRLNPLVRPSRTRRENNGEDFMIDGFFEGSRFSRLSCSFPDCVPENKQPKRCDANLNFESFYSDEFGWETYTNTSQAAFYCSLPVVNVTVFGGARIIPERLAVRRPFSNNIQRPLVDEPTNEEILVGDAPVPDRFTIQGIPVREEDVPFYTGLLDAPNTYGFGDGEQVFVQTDLVCYCRGINILQNNEPVLFIDRNCTDIIGPLQMPDDLCAEAIANDTNVVDCVVGDDSELVCTKIGNSFEGFILADIVNCTLPVYLTLNESFICNQTLVNGTLVNVTCYQLVNETRYVWRVNVGDLNLCILEEEDIFRLEFREGTLNQCLGPAYYSVGGDFRALNITWRDLEFYLHYGLNVEDDEVEQAMLATLEPAIDVIFERVGFDGRGVEPPARMQGLRLQIGLDVPETLGRKQRNRRPPVYSVLLIQNSTFSNFLFFETILNNTEGSAEEEDEVFEFPYIVALDVEYVNVLFDDPTELRLLWNNFSDIDRTAVRVRYANDTLFENNRGERSGGRSLDTPATYWFEANPASFLSRIALLSNNLTQIRPVTYPFLGDLTVPSYAALVWVVGLRDQAVMDCLQNNDTVDIDQCLAAVFPQCCPALVVAYNFWCGLPIALRMVGEKPVLSEYVLRNVPGMPVPIFDDDLAALREIALVNDVSLDGTWCDIVLGPPEQDWFGENLCCQESCGPRPPGRCRVNSGDPMINPANVFWNTHLFRDPNDAMELCQAASRIIDFERPDDSAEYEVRLVADVMEPPILVYKASWTGQVYITITDTFPISGLVSPGAVSIPIDWTDSSLGPLMFEIIIGEPLFETTSIEVSGRLQLPPDIPEDVTTPTPLGWPLTIDITFTFCAPGNMLAPVPSFPFVINYTSPAINVNTPSFDYAAILFVNWTWSDTATLRTQTGITLNGVGVPELLCNGHTPTGADITVQNVQFLHADPCVDFSLNMTTCPCTTPGLATWHQLDSAPAPNLRLLDNAFNGRGYDALAIDGEYWNRTEVRRTQAFIDYRSADPGYVVRLLPSTTQDCCAQACENEFYVVDNVFIGEDSVSLTGNLVYVGPVEYARINDNIAVDAGGQDTVHPQAALFYVTNCPGLALNGEMSGNSAERTAGTVVQTRLPPNDCYWTVAEADELSTSPAFKMRRNVQIVPAASAGAPVCLRPINWPKSSPSGDCQKAVRELRAQNPECDGTLADVWIEACDKDVCLAKLLGCPGVDPACDAATNPPCSPDDECSLCNGKCGRPLFDPPLWVIIATAAVIFLLLCACLCCTGPLVWLFFRACPRTITTRKPRPPASPIDTFNEAAAWHALRGSRQ